MSLRFNKTGLAGALVAAIFLSACGATFGTMDRIMTSWEGAYINDVISQWGYPHEERNVVGRKLYVWNHNKTYSVPESSSSTVNVIGNTAYVNTTTYGGGTIYGSCQRIIEVDEHDMVSGWQWTGNNCPILDFAFGYANWERNRVTAERSIIEGGSDQTSGRKQNGN